MEPAASKQDSAHDSDTTVSTAVHTFLIADVRGYTRFTLERGDAAAAELAVRFAHLVRASVIGRAGTVIELRGDEALAVFTSTRQALWAAIELQARVDGEASASQSPAIKIGIGLDAGEAIPVEDGYRGAALNLAARLCSLAGGGEVFVSEGVTHLAGKIDGLAYVDRGLVRLKGLDVPVRVMQVAPDHTIQELPPLQPVVRFSNLPPESTPFIGRHGEADTIKEMLRRPSVRLLTLTGPGGSGKTRLALHVAAGLAAELSHGVCFVSLAPVDDPALIGQSIATALGIREVPGKHPLEAVKLDLQDKRMLLLLDNFEQLTEGAAVVAELVENCSGVQVLVTSQTRLNLYAENVYAVPSLSLPDPDHLPGPATLIGYDAVAFFVSRARAAESSFGLSDANYRAVAEICYRLDGLPLAIELAAARARLLPVPTILAQLQRQGASLRILTGGARDLPTRLRTLRAAIDWSYGLLRGGEQALFARLSVFVGGCTLDAAEVVCNAEGDLDIDVFEGMASLIDKSLLRQEIDPGWGDEYDPAAGTPAREPRFRMLATIREYACEQLVAGGTERKVRRRHADHCLALATEAEPHLRHRDADWWLEKLAREQANMRAALRWALDNHESELALSLVAALQMFWTRRGHFREASAWMGEVVDQGDSLPRGRRAKALCLAGEIAVVRGDEESGARLLLAGLAEAQEAGEVVEQEDALGWLGIWAARQAEYAEATSYWEQGLSLAENLGDVRRRAWYIDNLAGATKYQGDIEQATALYQQSLGLYRELGDEKGVAEVLQDMAFMDLGLGNGSHARELLIETLGMVRSLKDQYYVLASLEGLTCVAAAQGNAERAARLWGAAESLSGETGAPLMPQRQALHDRYRSAILEQADATEFALAWQRGLVAPLEQTIQYALAEDV